MLNTKKLLTKLLEETLLVGWEIKKYNVSNNGTVVVPVKSAARGFFLIGSYGTQKTAIYAVGSNSSGTCGHSLLAQGSLNSGFTLTNGTNQITVANNNVGSMGTIFYITSA